MKGEKCQNERKTTAKRFLEFFAAQIRNPNTCERASNIDQRFRRSWVPIQCVAAPGGVQSARRFTITSQPQEPATDLYGALAALLEQLRAEGWQAECEPEYGFTFIHRGADRRLVMVTGRDPARVGRQSFNPFGESEG
jgi:hypothetical protein